MTAARRRRKSPPFIHVAAALALAGLALAAPLRAGTSEYVVTDRHTGLAISGYDPVAYFIDRKAVPGRDDQEYAFAGTVWRFKSEGNRGAFVDDPDLYMPRLGGYDPVGVARGVALPGDPRLWRLAGERLYLFHTSQARAAFAEDTDGIMALAERNWPSVQLTLVP